MKNKILQSDDAKLIPVEVPEWDTTLFLRVISGSERTNLDKKTKELDRAGRAGDIAVFMVVLCVCDEAGNRVFSETDTDALNAKSGLVIDRLALAAARHNGIGQDAVDAAKKG